MLCSSNKAAAPTKCGTGMKSNDNSMIILVRVVLPELLRLSLEIIPTISEL
jgi:hypothetical protein